MKIEAVNTELVLVEITEPASEIIDGSNYSVGILALKSNGPCEHTRFSVMARAFMNAGGQFVFLDNGLRLPEVLALSAWQTECLRDSHDSAQDKTLPQFTLIGVHAIVALILE